MLVVKISNNNLNLLCNFIIIVILFRFKRRTKEDTYILGYGRTTHEAQRNIIARKSQRYFAQIELTYQSFSILSRIFCNYEKHVVPYLLTVLSHYLLFQMELVYVAA